MSNYDTIVRYLSSSELNRLHKNGVSINKQYTPHEWLSTFNATWVPRKLRRKLYTLYSLDILPVSASPVIGLTFHSDDWFKEMNDAMLKAYFKAEDELIMKGTSK